MFTKPIHLATPSKNESCWNSLYDSLCMIATCLSNHADQQAGKESSRTPQHIEQSSVKPAFHKFTSGAWNMELHVPQTLWNLEHRKWNYMFHNPHPANQIFHLLLYIFLSCTFQPRHLLTVSCFNTRDPKQAPVIFTLIWDNECKYGVVTTTTSVVPDSLQCESGTTWQWLKPEPSRWRPNNEKVANF